MIIFMKELAMAKHLIAQHRVADFDKFKVALFADVIRQEAVGMTDLKVLRDVENPLDVTLIWTVEDIGKARKYISDPETIADIVNAGVTSEVTFLFLSDA
jgi:hypothetical protein